MPRRALVMMTVLQMVGLPAGAAEFLPSWEAQGVWSSNVFNSVSDEQSDFSIRTGPKLRVREPAGDLTYDVYYKFDYEAYARIDGLSDISDGDQYFAGRSTWRATPTTRIMAYDNFAYTTRLDSLFDDAALASTVVVGRERVTTNNAEASLVHDLNPLWQLTASVGNRIFAYESNSQSDATLTNGTLQLTRALNPRLLMGGGAQYQRQDFAEVEDIPSRGTSVYQAFGMVNYQFSPTFRLMARAGPAFVQPDEVEVEDTVNLPSYIAVDPSTCPKRSDGTPVYNANICVPASYRAWTNFPFQPAELGEDVAGIAPAPRDSRIDVPFVGDLTAGDSLNYFGTISITKEWREWRALLSYSRSASNSSGLNGSTVLDQLTGNLNWTPSELWEVNFDAIYSTQSALNEQPQREIALQQLNEFQFINGVPAVGVFGIPFEVDTGDSSISNQVEITTLYFTLSASRRISRRLRLVGSAGYWQQETGGGVVMDRRVRDLQFSLGFTWAFDPIPL
jgi:hypothetical protein